ncbi:MAG: hypothetical protein H0W72_07310 [Planctomycetes bacterium]|nr:hypothetical protein [Planctomycetota bacterium]
MCSVAITLFFLRFWRRSKDRLFLAFAIAFLIFAVSRTGLAFLEDDESRTYIYLLRLAAFLAILWAIVDKNRSLPKGVPPTGSHG